MSKDQHGYYRTARSIYLFRAAARSKADARIDAGSGKFSAERLTPLISLYFYFHSTIDTIVQQQKTGNIPAEVQRIDRETAANFGLPSAQGLPTLRSVSLSYSAELKAIDDEENAHANARAKLELAPVAAQMRSFEARRQAIVNRGMAALRTQMSSADWAGFQNFINGTFRTSYSIISVSR